MMVIFGLETGTDVLGSDPNCPSLLSGTARAALLPDLAGCAFVFPLLTFHHLVISKVQIEEEKHMQSSKSPTQDEPLGMPHGA